jgi:hypothetical protein
MRSTLLCLAALAALAAPATATAAPPANDNRADAQVLADLPGAVEGTVVEATLEENEPSSSCTFGESSVWYRVVPGRDGRVILDLQAGGDLDAFVDVYSVRRSQVSSIDCQATDEDGQALLAVEVERNQAYLIRVARRSNSVEGTFRLGIDLGAPLATPPGPRLPDTGASGTLESVRAPDAAYSVALRAGTTYRFNLASRACTRLELHPPGATDFDAPVRSERCGGYMVFTPGAGEGGVYSLRALASRGQRSTRFTLRARRAGDDDTAPGRFIRNYARVRGALDANGIDVVDLYRFDVERRSTLDLRLRSDAGFRMTLLSAGGKRIARTSGSLTRRLRPGRYFAAVRAGRGAAGSYRLRRVSRTITRTAALVDGRPSTVVPPGRTVSLQARITPAVAGPVVLFLERFDPIEGWQFVRAYRLRAAAGRAAVSFRPPFVGRWRIRAEYRGTRGSSPSRSGYARLRVQGPLEE